MREAVASYEARLVSWDGGNMRNAIPREACAVLAIPAENEEELLGLVKYCEDLFNEEFSAIETPISLRQNVWSFLPVKCPKNSG